LERLREKSLTDPEGAQNDYVTLRRFLIEHPYAQVTEISRAFSETNYINAADVGTLYVVSRPSMRSSCSTRTKRENLISGNASVAAPSTSDATGLKV
jgi:hypothetical protein